MTFGSKPRLEYKAVLSSEDKDHIMMFAVEAIKKIGWQISEVSERKLVASPELSWISRGEMVTIKVDNDSIEICSESNTFQITDWGRNRNNIRKLLAVLADTRDRMTPDEIALKSEEFASLVRDNSMKGTAPENRWRITPLLILINLAVFILMVVAGAGIFQADMQSLADQGANFRPFILAGQWWRLFTSFFMHADIFHLFFNMLALVFIGIVLEPYIGRERFFAGYMISGFAASVTSFGWNNLTLSVGASGAIFGMYGVLVSLLTTRVIDRESRKSLLIPTIVFVLFNITNGLKQDSGIDNAAHVGGLLAGLITGYIYLPGLNRIKNKKAKFATIASAVLLVAVYTLTIFLTEPPRESSHSFNHSTVPGLSTPDINVEELLEQKASEDIFIYKRKMEEFFVMESMALEVFTVRKDGPKEKILREINDRGLYYWNENLRLLNSLNELKLPRPLKEKNKKLAEYCKLRIKSYKLMYRSIDEDTDRFESQLDECNSQIESIILEIAENPNPKTDIQEL